MTKAYFYGKELFYRESGQYSYNLYFPNQSKILIVGVEANDGKLRFDNLSQKKRDLQEAIKVVTLFKKGNPEPTCWPYSDFKEINMTNKRAQGLVGLLRKLDIVQLEFDKKVAPLIERLF